MTVSEWEAGCAHSMYTRETEQEMKIKGVCACVGGSVLLNKDFKNYSRFSPSVNSSLSLLRNCVSCLFILPVFFVGFQFT